MCCCHLQLEGAKKTKRLYLAIFWVWLGMAHLYQMSGQPLDSWVYPGSPWQDSGQGGCLISEPKKTICVEPSRSLFSVLPSVLSSPSGSFPGPGLNCTLSWVGVRGSLQTAILGLLDLTKSLFICVNSFIAICFSIYSNKCQLLLIFSLQSSVKVVFVLIRSQVQRVK